MLLGYNTNGFAHHRLSDAVTILAGIGYQSLAITLERDHLDPPNHRGVADCVSRLKPLIEETNLRATIETGARFILDPRRKHQPTLISRSSEDRWTRIEFIKAATDIAAAVAADSVSLWSGAPDDDAGEEELYDRLTQSLRPVLQHAERQHVSLTFEPEPGMFIDRLSRFERLCAAIDHTLFGLTLDIGHVCCLDDGNLREHVVRWRDRLWNVHIEDMRRGVHEHRFFGEGEVDFTAVFHVLKEIRYSGPVHVELPRHSHNAVEVAKRSYSFLRRLV